MARRVQAVFMRKNGLNRAEIARNLAVSLSSIENWISAFNNYGLNGLKKRVRRSPPHMALTKSQKKIVWQTLKRKKKINVDYVKNLVKQRFGKEYKNMGSYYQLIREARGRKR